MSSYIKSVVRTTPFSFEPLLPGVPIGSSSTLLGQENEKTKMPQVLSYQGSLALQVARTPHSKALRTPVPFNLALCK